MTNLHDDFHTRKGNRCGTVRQNQSMITHNVCGKPTDMELDLDKGNYKQSLCYDAEGLQIY